MRSFLNAIIILTCLSIAGAAQTSSVQQSVVVPRPAIGDQRYAYIPFEVPPKTESLTLSCLYDKKNGANVIDLGLFDSRFDPSRNGIDGFRGWSGGRRDTIFITPREATNGYVAGPLPAGTWRAVLGLYKVAPEGVEVRCTASFGPVGDAAARKEFEREASVRFDFPQSGDRMAPETGGGLKWFRGDLHMHSYYSDGDWTLRGILDFARASGLDFVGLTEHNTFAHHAEANRLAKSYPGILVLRGEEVTTYGGHFNVWGLKSGDLVDFRVTPGDAARLSEVVAGVRARGLVASINHPAALCGGCDWSYGDDWTKLDSVEIWNGPWSATNEAALRKWNDLLKAGKRVTAIGSSDSHRPPAAQSPWPTNLALGAPTVYAGMKELTQASLIDAIRRGRVWTGAGPRYTLSFTATGAGRATIGGTLRPKNGRVRVKISSGGFPAGARFVLTSRAGIVREGFAGILDETFETSPGGDFFRLEVRDEKGSMLAMTNPIFVE